MMRTLVVCGALFGALLLAPSAARAVPIPISGSNGLEDNGRFTGTFDYIPINDTSGTVIVELTNSLLTDAGGLITGFAFNIPGTADVTGATLDTPSFFPLLVIAGGSSFDNSVDAQPFGSFDIGAALGGDWQGGGSPNGGIPRGSTETFTFHLEGIGGLDAPLGPGNFLSTLSNDPQGGGAQAFVVRFRGFDGGGSDKVPIDEQGAPIPEPGTAILLSLGLASLSARRLRSRKR